MSIRRIGVLTSGGDAPGMNAAIRAVVRTSLHNNLEVMGIFRGFEGLINEDLRILDHRSVSNIIGRGGDHSKNRPFREIYDRRGPETGS